jgi:hypothetical protein
MSDYVMLIVLWTAALYSTANAIYAFRSPTEFLKANWTTRRGLSPETPKRSIRELGIIFAAAAVFLIWISCKVTLHVLHRR